MTERTHRRHPATESAHAHVPRRRRQLLTRACRKSRGRARDRKRSASCPRQLHPAPRAMRMRPERRQWQSQRVQGCARMQPTDLWATSECRTHRPASKAPLPCARPVPPNVSLRLAAPTERLPGGRQRHPTTSLRGPASVYRRLRRSPPRHVARCTSPCRAVAVGCDCHPWAGRTGHGGLRLQLRFLERGYTARQLGGCAVRAARPLCAAQAVVAVGAVAETAG